MRQAAIAAAKTAFDTGPFMAQFEAMVATPTDSVATGAGPALLAYLTDVIAPRLAAMGAVCRIIDNPISGGPPFLIAERREDDDMPTILTYGHGDTVPPMQGQWAAGRDPLALTPEGDRLYGRGTADNKGQHHINLSALEAVLAIRGQLGFNLRVLVEMGEEAGSPGLHELCVTERERLTADALIASDGPRLTADQPLIFGGARGCIGFSLVVRLRDGAHHSGNWGGLLSDPAMILAHALATITDARGTLLIPEWRPDSLSPEVRDMIATCAVSEPVGGPAIDHEWGDPALSAAEKVFGWNSFAVLALEAGNPARPVNAIQPHATAHCQLRFVVGTAVDDIIPALRRHLDAAGFSQVDIVSDGEPHFRATRLSPTDPWAQFAAASIATTTGATPAIAPNLGGSLPNEEFAEVLGMPTIWVPHSYPGCSQHAPDEHALAPVLREGLTIMTGLFWDIGEQSNDHPHGKHKDL